MNVLGTLALSLTVAVAAMAFAATGGNAQTATNLKCDGCVGAKDLAKKAVRKSHIADKAVSPSKLLAPTGAAGTASVTKLLALDNQIVTKIVVDIPRPGVVVVNASGYYRFLSDGARGICAITTGTVAADPTIVGNGGTAADDERESFAGTRAFVEKKAGVKTYNLVCLPDGGDQVEVAEAVMTAIYAPTNILAP